MFSDKEIQAYKKISAPPELYSEIKSSAVTKNRFASPVLIKTMGAVAACLVIAVAVMIFAQKPEHSIVCNGQELRDSVLFYDISPVSDMREFTASPKIAIPFELDLREDTEITVSQGETVTADGKVIEGTVKEGKIELWWEIPKSNSDISCEMMLKGEKSTTVITLTYDNEAKAVRATKITK